MVPNASQSHQVVNLVYVPVHIVKVNVIPLFFQAGADNVDSQGLSIKKAVRLLRRSQSNSYLVFAANQIYVHTEPARARNSEGLLFAYFPSSNLT